MTPYQTYMALQKQAGFMDSAKAGLGEFKRKAGEAGAAIKSLAADLEHTRQNRRHPAENMASYEARMAQKQADDARPDPGAQALVAGGSALAAKGLLTGTSAALTGRETFYHGVGAGRAAADNIRQEGILAKHTGQAGGSTDILKGHPSFEGVYDRSLGHVFVTPDRGLAGQYAYKGHLKDTHNMTAQQAQDHIMARPNEVMRVAGGRLTSAEKHNLVELSVPTWKPAYASRRVDNPEVTHIMQAAHDQLKMHGIPEHMRDPLAKAVLAVQGLGGMNTGTFKGDLGPEVIKGSPHYQKLTGSEVGDYIRARPKQFAGGVGRAALGAAALGVAGHTAYQMASKNQTAN